jgi:hypothetical protein
MGTGAGRPHDASGARRVPTKWVWVRWRQEALWTVRGGGVILQSERVAAPFMNSRFDLHQLTANGRPHGLNTNCGRPSVIPPPLFRAAPR